MRLTIRAKQEIETLEGTERPVFHFWAPDDGGYVRLEGDGRPGTLGQQICAGGEMSGSTVYCNPRNFEGICRRWYRAYMRKNAAT
jgi:hypothetical protein